MQFVPNVPGLCARCIRALGKPPAFLMHCRWPRPSLHPSQREKPSQHLDFHSRFCHNILCFSLPRIFHRFSMPISSIFHINIERMFVPRSCSTPKGVYLVGPSAIGVTTTMGSPAFTTSTPGTMLARLATVCAGAVRGHAQRWPCARPHIHHKRLYKSALFCRRQPLQLRSNWAKWPLLFLRAVVASRR